MQDNLGFLQRTKRFSLVPGEALGNAKCKTTLGSQDPTVRGCPVFALGGNGCGGEFNNHYAKDGVSAGSMYMALGQGVVETTRSSKAIGDVEDTYTSS